MSRALQISLMILTAALCGVCVVQWQRESRFAVQEKTLALELEAARSTLAAQQEKLSAWEQEITRLNTALTDQSAAQKSLPELEAKLAEATRRLEANAAALTQNAAAGETLGTQLKKALDERDALAARLNERTREFNALAEKYRKGR